MYGSICIQIVSGGLYVVIKLNVPLKAIGIEMYTACKLYFSSSLRLALLLLPSLIFRPSLSSPNQRKHTLIVAVNESLSAVTTFGAAARWRNHFISLVILRTHTFTVCLCLPGE